MSSGSLPPVCLSYGNLCRILSPLVEGYAWGQDTIRDLWLLGAPMPPAVGAAAPGETVRLIVPSQLMAWLTDVLNRQGRPLDEAATLYSRMIREGN